MLKEEGDCIFCNSYKKYKERNLILYENRESFSVFNYKPAMPGHALIVTKQHVTDLSKIGGSVLEYFIHAIPQTFKVIQDTYEQKPEVIGLFYKDLIENPPEPISKVFADQMLNHPHLTVKPIAYNWGMNYGYEAGQRAIHLHLHLFPRREVGLGIATAMRKHLVNE